MSTATMNAPDVSAKIQSAGENPFAPQAAGTKGPLAPAPVNGMYGFNSIQDFSGSLGNHNSDLTQTHGDALGFNAYLAKFYTTNFWFKDGGCKTWQYEEGTDDWQGLYGIDAVCVFYHSGHGNMDANGVFQAPTGGSWNNETWVFSNHNMKLANQNSRYIFWSTCLSCRIGGGNSPVKTWWADDNNPGFRMLFGYETTSVDSPDYGSNFWNHWNKGESFSTAFLNASWDISHTQAPSCVASGAANADATARLNNERFFDRGAVPRGWYSWRWYFAASAAARNKALPKELKIAEFAPVTFTADHLHQIAGKLGLQGRATLSHTGAQVLSASGKSVVVSAEGHLDVRLADSNHANTKTLEATRARQIADAQVAEHGLHAGEDYAFDTLRLTMNGGGSTAKAAYADQPYASETTVQYRQRINGVPVVNTDAGLIRVTVDNDGTVTRLHSSVRKVASLAATAKSMVADPAVNGAASAVAAVAPLSDTAVEAAFRTQLGHHHAAATLLEDETGYDAAFLHGRIVTQRVYEVTYEHDLKKRLKLTVARYE